MDEDRPLYSSPPPPDAWGHGYQPTGILDPRGRPILRKNACGFTDRDRYVIEPD